MANRFHTSRLIEIEARRAGRGELRNPPSLARRASMTTRPEPRFSPRAGRSQRNRRMPPFDKTLNLGESVRLQMVALDRESGEGTR